MSPRNIIRDQRVREERIEQILNAAIRVISTKGIGAASMSDIAKATGISIGNMYHYFKSKDDIFAEVLRQGQLNYGHNLSLLEKNTELDTYQILHQFACDWLANPINWAYTIMLQSARTTVSVPHHIRQDVTDRFTVNLQPMARIIERGQSQGHVVDGDPLQLAFYFVSLIQGLTLQRAPGYEIPVSINVDQIIRLFCPL
ncbi:TetR/AcrR family hemagglutinin/protease transcriptional regulator [Paenibacillus shirakamiensis]|uniref:TetR/AcrR family hemagglutinin/protease transcriptional regulator n=1 Tax=Paenibacillus shirakamiensis TaxID=1265935 RepID=A0ABS4JMY3_9BACL|nr:TetR/AcrR family transcriptional regulator [Paenibacillus shirakamiensis]MBP2002495.1 TetR/AcrR family hemagglutinin/protease transcriptional regulator [Paenibacillus shirakamiensis]